MASAIKSPKRKYRFSKDGLTSSVSYKNDDQMHVNVEKINMKPPKLVTVESFKKVKLRKHERNVIDQDYEYEVDAILDHKMVNIHILLYSNICDHHWVNLL